MSRVLLDEYIGLMKGYSKFTCSEINVIKDIGEDDVLLLVDMQNDFLPLEDAPGGGKFGVAEGKGASDVICELIEVATKNKSMILATRDYHPIDHCSFSSEGGPFPAHCVQGSIGSEFFPPVKDILTKCRDVGADIHVIFKGFHEDIDSFGGFPYTRELAKDRITAKKDLNGSCGVCWTGGFELKSSNVSVDINAPPDILAIMHKKNMAEVISSKVNVNPKARKIYVVGLAFDYCVLDTAINARAAGFENVFIILDGSRAANIPGFGTFGSGFLQDPILIAEKLDIHGVKLLQLS